jgi:hypothetical protein
VIGVIEAWGRVEVHLDGFRAEHARPVALFTDPHGPSEHRQLIERLANLYAAAVVEVGGGEDLAAYCEGLVCGLHRGDVERLLASGVELIVRPHATGYLSGRDQLALGGSGLLLEGEEPPNRWHSQLDVELPGVRVARVAGTSFRPHALQHEDFDPGRPLRLLPEPHNTHDPNAIGVWDRRLERQAGYIPAELAAEVGRMLRDGQVKVAMSLWQWRDLDTGDRIGLHVLLSGTEPIEVCAGGSPSQKKGLRVSLAEEVETLDDAIEF